MQILIRIYFLYEPTITDDRSIIVKWLFQGIIQAIISH